LYAHLPQTRENKPAGYPDDPYTNPKAFINWIFLAEQLKYYAGSVEQAGSNEEFKTHLFTDVPVNKSGYLYIYTSNEATNIDVPARP
jgi:hypothetical protein